MAKEKIYMKSLLFKAQKRTFHRLLWPLAVMDVRLRGSSFRFRLIQCGIIT